MDVGTLTAHLEKQRSLLKAPPAKHAVNGTLQAYKEFIQREIARTERKIEEVKARPVKIGKA